MVDDKLTSEELISSPVTDLSELVIQPSRGWFELSIRDLWQYRELLFFLTWRDIKSTI